VSNDIESSAVRLIENYFDSVGFDSRLRIDFPIRFDSMYLQFDATYGPLI